MSLPSRVCSRTSTPVRHAPRSRANEPGELFEFQFQHPLQSRAIECGQCAIRKRAPLCRWKHHPFLRLRHQLSTFHCGVKDKNRDDELARDQTSVRVSLSGECDVLRSRPKRISCSPLASIEASVLCKSAQRRPTSTWQPPCILSPALPHRVARSAL
ncbi:MAG: hypothetical protein ACI841_004102 [Planctomycetota bacterium]|jgi:hypothetical protein